MTTQQNLTDAAAAHLEAAGLRVLDRDWTCADGTLPIVAQDGRTLAAVTVRDATEPRPGIREITPRDRARLRRIAVRWLVAHGVLFDEIRLDVVLVCFTGPGRPATEHIRSAG